MDFYGRAGSPGVDDHLLGQLPLAIGHWRERDPVLAGLAEDHPPEPVPRQVEDPFASLVASIANQQVSLAAGRTIYGRVVEAAGDLTAEGVLAAGEQALRSAGLSRAKVASVLDLATRCTEGRLNLHALASRSDAEVHEQLVAVRGIGVWTAKMFLMFHLQRPDISAPEDLGLRIAAAHFYGGSEKEAAALLRERARLWSPYNTLASRVLWSARRVVGASP